MNKSKRPENTDRLPPHDVEAEAALLSCILMPGQALEQCEEANLVGLWFYDLRHQHIYAAAWELASQGKAVDVVTVGTVLKDKDELEPVGGYAYLTQLADLAPSSANAPVYIGTLKQKWLARQILKACTEASDQAFGAQDPAKILYRLESNTQELSQSGQVQREAKLLSYLPEIVGELEDYHRGHAQMVGLSTGLEYNDKLLCGLGGDNGNYIVLSARPGMGKTSLAMQIAVHVALEAVWFEPMKNPETGLPMVEQTEKGERPRLTSHKGMPVGIFSLEMTGKALVKRMLFQRAEADMQRWRTGYATQSDFDPLVQANLELARAKIFIDDAGRCTIESLKTKARRMHREHGIKLFMIDYIQLMRSSLERFRDDRVQELAEISGEIVNLTKELKVPFIVMAQMNRDYEKEPNRAPRLSDLKDCGSIEQDADLVGFLYSPKKAEDDTYKAAMEQRFGQDWSKYPSRVDLLWQKNRYGPCGPVQLLFQRSCTRFFDWGVWRKQRGLMDPAAGANSGGGSQNHEGRFA